VRGVVDQIKQHGRVIRGYMGLLPDDLTDSERRAHGVEDGTGIILMEVYADGPAAAADLRVGDILVRMNDTPIYSRRDALLISASTAPGDIVEVTGIRDGERFTTTVIAGERPQGLYEPVE
jgi:S1-C subfamily serine protease